MDKEISICNYIECELGNCPYENECHFNSWDTVNTKEYWLYDLNEKIDTIRLIMARIREDE